MDLQDPDLSRYRPNAGVVLLNAQGLCWLGRRKGEAGPYAWQWPQGGMDRDEDPYAAAVRELYEETGARESQIALLGYIPDWLVYEFPPEVKARKPKGWDGQKQRWFCFRWLGEDTDFDLTAVPPQEFEAFEWAPLEEAVRRIIPWKRPVYEAVCEAFAPLTEPAGRRG